MRYLRTVSTRRLLALIAGVVAVIAGGTAIAVAAVRQRAQAAARVARRARSTARSPRRRSRASRARISFTNHLIDSLDLQGSDPILSGRQRPTVAVATTGGCGSSCSPTTATPRWSSPTAASGSTTRPRTPAYEGKLPARLRTTDKQTSGNDRIPTIAADPEADQPARAARQPQRRDPVRRRRAARRTPFASRPSTTAACSGRAELAWDAERGVPLRFAIYARGQRSPVIELKATDISYGTVPSSDFNVSPPSGRQDRHASTSRPARPTRPRTRASTARAHREVSGAAAVAKKVLVRALVAPNTLVGLPAAVGLAARLERQPGRARHLRTEPRRDRVIEQAATAAAPHPQAPSGGDQRGMSLPSVTINGATGQELDTRARHGRALHGRGGVDYTVLGSVPAAAADAAARAL